MVTTTRGRRLDRVVKVVITVRRLDEGFVRIHLLVLVEKIVPFWDLMWTQDIAKLNDAQVIDRKV